MKLEIVFLIVKQPSTDAANLAGDVLYRLVGDQIHVKLRADLGDHLGERCPVVLGRQILETLTADPAEIAMQDLQLVPRCERKTVANDNGLDVVVKQNGDQGVLEARNDHRFVDKAILGPPHVQETGLDAMLLGRRDAVDDQHLEIRPRVSLLLQAFDELFFLSLLFAMHAERNGTTTIGVAHQRPDHATDPALQRLVILGLQQASKVMEGGAAGKRPVRLDRFQKRQDLVRLPPEFGGVSAGLARGKAHGAPFQSVPTVGPQLRGVVEIGQGRGTEHRRRRRVRCHVVRLGPRTKRSSRGSC